VGCADSSEEYPCVTSAITGTIGIPGSPSLAVTAIEYREDPVFGSGAALFSVTIPASKSTVGGVPLTLIGTDECDQTLSASADFEFYAGAQGNMEVSRYSPAEGMIAGGDEINLIVKNMHTETDSWDVSVVFDGKTVSPIDFSLRRTNPPMAYLKAIVPSGSAGVKNCAVRVSTLGRPASAAAFKYTYIARAYPTLANVYPVEAPANVDDGEVVKVDIVDMAAGPIEVVVRCQVALSL
jgi:hypothetical protein